MRLTRAQAEKMLGRALEPVKAPKFRNKKCQWKGIVFDSIRERDRYIFLENEQKEGRITDLNRQVSFQLLPAQKEGDKVIEKPCSYVADFTYCKDGKWIVEDAKGVRTPVFILKRKMMLYFHGIRVREV